MVLTKDKAENTGLKVKANITVTIKAIVIIVVQAMHLKTAQHMVNLTILVIRKTILSLIVDLGNKARAKVVQDGGPIPTKDNPGMINMK